MSRFESGVCQLGFVGAGKHELDPFGPIAARRRPGSPAPGGSCRSRWSAVDAPVGPIQPVERGRDLQQPGADLRETLGRAPRARRAESAWNDLAMLARLRRRSAARQPTATSRRAIFSFVARPAEIKRMTRPGPPCATSHWRAPVRRTPCPWHRLYAALVVGLRPVVRLAARSLGLAGITRCTPSGRRGLKSAGLGVLAQADRAVLGLDSPCSRETR